MRSFPRGASSSKTHSPLGDVCGAISSTNAGVARFLPFTLSASAAAVGDLFMSLIHTCQSCYANSFEYLIELQRHAIEVAANPAAWIPWNYRDTLAHAPPVAL